MRQITLRRGPDRGRTRIDWLDSWHSFSFGHYDDPSHRGYRSLRVINDDIIGPGGGFGMHGHRDMEILTWVLEGALEHQDSLGHRAVLHPGRLQVMSAGRGIRHSEVNASQTEPLRLLQIWIEPSAKGLPPAYHEQAFDAGQRAGRWQLLAAGEPSPNAALIHADARVHVAQLEPGQSVTYDLSADRHAWLHVAGGAVEAMGETLVDGDALAGQGPGTLVVQAVRPAQLLLFDLA